MTKKEKPVPHEFKPRTMLGIIVKSDFEETDIELQRLCEAYGFDQSKVVRELIRLFVSKITELEDALQDTFYISNNDLKHLIDICRDQAVTV